MAKQAGQAPPAFAPVPGIGCRFDGFVGSRLAAAVDHWLLPAPLANPAMLEMFRFRDRHPLRNMVPWAGEFAGKYLTSAVQVWRGTGDDRLRGRIEWFVKELVSLQAEDGYLGPWPAGSRLTGRAPNCEGGTWDAWGHYHVMLGLLLWNESTSDREALACARRIGDLLCAKFLGAVPGQRLVDTGSTEMNLAPIHGLALLHRAAGERCYLELALQIKDEFAASADDGKPLAGDYLRAALDGTEFFQIPKPRWESLHPIMGLAELYRITGDSACRQAFEHIWHSIAKLDRHNNGGFSSGEQAQGNPYHPGAIETCCTVAWMAMSVEMLKLTGSSIVADELELSTLNSGLGMQSPSGRWVTYNTPMDGIREASAHTIVFQARAGQPELNCCSVNGPRALGLLSDWAVMRAHDGGIVINYYGPCAFDLQTPAGRNLRIEQKTDYPKKGRIELAVSPARPERFAIRLRIPHWAARSSVSVNGKPAGPAALGSYFVLDRTWRCGDTIVLNLDMSLRFWIGERECEGKASVYRGPILLAYESRFNDVAPDAVPELDAATMRPRAVSAKTWLPPWMLFEFTAADGRRLRLCDFASAGQDGGSYVSWLKLKRNDESGYPVHSSGHNR
ncbi:MAG TPA: beta-L-arabinofuranosidase domain-containing protein [Planctomycetota bacterium]|nr:beta-L-arabinofuranosidase domain-containing protein [Planctomycetota bacterium]